jgi:hypothetical protein
MRRLKTSEEMAAAVDRAVGALERIIADAQKDGEIVEGDPAHLTLVVGAALQGTATLAANGLLDAQTTLDGVPRLVHLILHGLKPR